MAGSKSESPLEEWMEHEFLKWSSPDCSVEQQVWFSTSKGKVRVDFVIELPDGKKIVVECDGKDFHDPISDEDRDFALIDEGKVSAVLRIPGSCLFRYSARTMYALMTFYPFIGSRRAHEVLARRFSDVKREMTDENCIWIPPSSLIIRRKAGSRRA